MSLFIPGPDHGAVVWLLVIQRHCDLGHVGPMARTRKVSDVKVRVSKECVVTPVRVFGVTRVRYEVDILIWPK